MKVALVHDYLLRMGGAERVLLELAKLYPEAPIYTLLCDKQKIFPFFPKAEIRTSFLQKFPGFIKKNHKYLLPFLPVAAETFDLRDFDVVISSSSAFVKSIITRPGTVHISYCHAPSRFLWDWTHHYLNKQEIGPIRRILANLLVHYLRLWDKSSAKRIDYFLANSKATRDKIKKYYRQEAFVIYPPVALPLWPEFLQAEDKNYFLIISQLTPYKRIDLAISAFNKLKLPLVIIGDGPEIDKLRKLDASHIKILGWQDDEIKKEYLKNCTAFILPGEEDFGIAAVEAMGWGKPVLAFRAGGACETVIEGVTGEFFSDPTPEILADGVRRLRENLGRYSALVIRKWAEKFSEERFRQEIMDFMGKRGYNK